MPKNAALSHECIIEGAKLFKNNLIQDYGCGNRVAYLSDKVWKDLSKHFNFLMTPAALHVFITSNRGGILKILGLVKENEAEPKSANQLDDIDIDKRDHEPPIIPSGNALRIAKAKEIGMNQRHSDYIKAVKIMKSEDTYKNCIHDIGLDPFYIHFHVPETLHLYRAYCKSTAHPSIIVDTTGSIVKRFSKLGLEKTRTLLLYDAIVYDDIRKHSFTVCSMISEGHDNNIIYNWLSRWLKNDVPSPKETCCDMSIALLSALVRSFTQYTTLNDYMGVCAQLLLGTISLNSNLLPRCFIRVDVAHFIKNLTKWSCFTTVQRRVKEVYLRVICHIIKSQSLTEIRSILLSIFIVASNETNQLNSLTGRPTSCQIHEAKLLEAASSGFVHLEDDFNDLLNNSTSEDVPTIPKISASDLNYMGLEEQNSQFTAWVENIYEESKNYLEDGTGLNPLALQSIIPFLIKSIKMLPLWSGIMVPIFGYGTPTKSSAAVESMFHKTKNLVFKDVDLPTTLETFLERRIISLKGSALLNNYETLSEENEVHSSPLMSNVSQFNAICDNENNIPLLSCSKNENKITRLNCQELESSNQINAIRISSKVKYPLCSSGRIQETSGMHTCNTCGLPVHAIEGSSYNYVSEDTVKLCSDCFNGSINTNNTYSSNTLSQIFETPTEGHIDNGEQSILNLYTEQKINNSNKSQNQIKKIGLIKNNDDISNENIATENWNRQKKKSTKSYLLPNPHLKYIDMTARQTKSLPLLKNGSRAEDLKALSLKKYGSVILSNTCAFDTAVFLLMVAFCDSEKYFNSLSSSHEDYKFIEFIKKILSKGVTVDTYRQRARIIIETQKPTSTPLKYGQKLVKCDTTFGNLLKCMLPKCPTLIDKSSCSNDQCNKNKIYAYAYLTYIFHENFDTLQDFINTRIKQSKNKCTNELCNGTVTLIPELSKDHIFVETFKFNEGVSKTTLKIKLNDIPEVLTIDNFNYQLRGITSFVNGGELSVSSVGHYKAYCKRMSSWEVYDDLATNSITVNSMTKVSCDFILYTV